MISDDSVNANEIKKILAASIHETMALIPYHGTLGSLSDCIKKLMTSSTKDIREVLSRSLDKIIKYYVKDKDF